jgi:DNA-binding transcriptional ArsR family regulator
MPSPAHPPASAAFVLPEAPAEPDLVAKYFRGLGDPARLRILDLLREHDELSVGGLVSTLGQSQPKISNPLACLRWCGFVETRREHPNVYYRIADDRVSELLARGQRRARRRLLPHRLEGLLMRDGGGDFEYDPAIIGSGGGAFAAAIAARREDLRVVMIGRDTVGETCVNVNCIRSKTLLAAAEAHHRASERRFPGIASDAGSVDFAALIAGKREIVERLRKDKYVVLGWRARGGKGRLSGGPAEV